VQGQRHRGIVRGYFRDFVQSVGNPHNLYGIRTRKVLGVFQYIYLTNVNLDYYQNNNRLSVDVGKLPNHVKSVSLSLDLSFLFYIWFIIIVRGYNNWY
jgi:hypothetical protein